jgi:acyl-CoA-binding protein
LQRKYQYNHWEKISKEGLSPADAEKKYIAKVKELQAKYGTN